MNKNRNEIAYQIARDLLNNDALDLNNFACNTDTVLNFVQKIILNHLKDYLNYIRSIVVNVYNI